jgi:hypothetical protein
VVNAGNNNISSYVCWVSVTSLEYQSGMYLQQPMMERRNTTPNSPVGITAVATATASQVLDMMAEYANIVNDRTKEELPRR